MKVIHKFACIKKLFTLKHSWNLAISPLKHSCFYAETLLRSIYTYIYLYLNTCSWQQQIVDNLFLKSFFQFLSIVNMTIILSACCTVCPAEKEQDAALHLSKPPYKHFEQIQGDELHPSAYFTCGEWNNPCHLSTKINLKRIAKPYAIKSNTHSINQPYSGGK